MCTKAAGHVHRADGAGSSLLLTEEHQESTSPLNAWRSGTACNPRVGE
jgi:hypothetical protein